MPDAGEYMGLYGIGAYERFNPWIYGGVTLYGAASGRRGFFFTEILYLKRSYKLNELKKCFSMQEAMWVPGAAVPHELGGLHVRPHWYEVRLELERPWTELFRRLSTETFPAMHHFS